MIFSKNSLFSIPVGITTCISRNACNCKKLGLADIRESNKYQGATDVPSLSGMASENPVLK